MPVGLGVVGVAVVLPGGDLVDQGLLVGDAPIEALPGAITSAKQRFEVGQMKTDTIAAVVSAFVATASFFVALFVVWVQRREADLRRGDVLAWANEVICALESLLLVAILKESQLQSAAAKAKLADITFRTAILIERGRMFCKNTVTDDWGSGKQPAYRDYRPTILDPIVVAYQIACGWGSADEETRLRMRL